MLDGGLEGGPDGVGLEVLDVRREGLEGAGEVVAGWGRGVGPDAHEDGETVQGGGDGLAGGAGLVL